MPQRRASHVPARQSIPSPNGALQHILETISPVWMSPVIYNAFRYGLVLLYLGTLFVVIGYHNPWVGFIRYLGLVMVLIGFFLVSCAVGQSCSRYSQRQRQSQGMEIQTISDHVRDTNSKSSLPTYDSLINSDLPTYEEAEALRLDPKFLQESWMKRHSVPKDFQLHYFPPLSFGHPSNRTLVTSSPLGARLIQRQDSVPNVFYGGIDMSPRSDNPSPHAFMPTLTPLPGYVEEDEVNSANIFFPSPTPSRPQTTASRRRSLHSELSTFPITRPATSRPHFEDLPEIHLRNHYPIPLTTNQFRPLHRDGIRDENALDSLSRSPSPRLRPRTIINRLRLDNLSEDQSSPRLSRTYSSSSFESSTASDVFSEPEARPRPPSPDPSQFHLVSPSNENHPTSGGKYVAN